MSYLGICGVNRVDPKKEQRSVLLCGLEFNVLFR